VTPYALLTDLAACLCNELTPEGEESHGLCFCGVMPGEVVAADAGWNCDDLCGMAWTRLESSYPATSLGEFQGDENTCGTFLGLDIELGVLRCVEGGDNGEAPEAAEWERATELQLGDMVAMRRAVQCCPALEEIDFLLGTYSPIGPQGLVAGGIWTVSVLI
jgi:hypothetical protein